MSQNFIDLAQAKELTKRYRENKAAMVTNDFINSLCDAETFDASAIQAVLNQPGCVEFRAYFGMKEDKTVCLVFVGVDANGKDIGATTKNGEEDVIVENGKQCPPYCQEEML